MNFVIQKADSKSFNEIADVIQSVLSSMDEKEWFAADNAEYTKHMLTTKKGTAYTAVVKETGAIAGVFMVTFPGNSSDNLGIDAGLPKDELLKVAHMDSAAVLPAYRGNHLQKKLMLAAENDLKKSGYQYLCCTIHPDNRYSLNSALSLGYQIITTCEKYGGYIRAVLMKKI